MTMENLTLELILKYGMDELEAKAFKIACIYLEKAQKLFPHYQHYRLPKGDPRKSELFRYCHTLLRKTQGKLRDVDYKLYVHAQLDIMRHIRKGELHPLISPSCLTGEKAWKRWLLWKSRYDKMLEMKMSASVAATIDVHNLEKIKRDLWKTKQFLIAWFDRLDPEDMVAALGDGTARLWYDTGSVCGYYFALSPVVKKWGKLGVDLSVYEKAVLLPGVTEYFEKEFSGEKQ